jgi:glycosyltransferase involved in cell wall biosynthesis
MKIALVSNDYEQVFPLQGYGGIESCVENMAFGLLKRNINFFVICPKRSITREYPFKIIETEELPTKISGKSASFFAFQAKQIIQKENPDLILSQSNWSADAFHDLNIPTICTFHDSCQKQFGWIKKYKYVKYRFLSNFQFNNWVKEDWEKQKSFVCASGLQDEEYLFNDTHNNYYLWCAGLRWGLQAKGLDIVIKLAEANQDKQFHIYGTGDKDIETYLVNKSKLYSNIFYGHNLERGSHHKEAFAKARAFLMPTKIPDTFPRTILESLSKGTPVIASTNGACQDMISNAGYCTDDFEKFNKALNIDFDRKYVYNHSRIYSIDNEINTLIGIDF